MAIARSSMRAYLRLSVLATAAVVLPPVCLFLAVAIRARTSAAVGVGALAALALALVLATLGSHLWRRRPESMDLSFSELTLWGFLRRRKAEIKLEQGAKILGLDRRGKPLRRARLSRSEKLKVLRDLAHALETKDPYTHGHSTRVEHLASKAAARLRLSDRQLEDLRLAATLHDVGKIRVPIQILRKPDGLTQAERAVVQEHSSVGAWMVSGVSNREVVAGVRYHHERWDGRGYPDGLAGAEIPMLARLIAVADAYDAMTSARPYRPGRDRREALKEIRLESGHQFDPLVVDAFLETESKHSPVLGLFSLGFSSRFLRRVFSWSGHTSTGVGPVVGAVGASSVLIASMLASPAGSPARQNAVDNFERADRASVAEVLADDVTKKAGTKRRRVTAKRSAVAAGEREDLDRATTPAPRAPDGPRPKDVPGGPDPGPPDDGDRPAPPDPPDPPAPPDPPPPPEAEKTHSDPQPDHGRDCPPGHPPQGAGPGSVKHCGG
ncbi:MAG: HD-GYP domain-containing protein [Actinomycetota bacterium]|nr:HD-GYP domain-containing protein [Actinomycetota bacterium]